MLYYQVFLKFSFSKFCLQKAPRASKTLSNVQILLVWFLKSWTGSTHYPKSSTWSTYFFYLLAIPQGTWDPTPPDSDCICDPCVGNAESSPLDCQGSPKPTFLMLLPSASWVIEYLLHARLCPAYRDTSDQGDVMSLSLMSVKNAAGQGLHATRKQDRFHGRAVGPGGTGSLRTYREERKGIQEGHAGHSLSRGHKAQKSGGPEILAQGMELRSVSGRSQGWFWAG